MPWSEILILAEVKPGHTLAIDSHWVLKEDFPLAAAARAGSERCRFGDPTSAGRFKDLEESLTPEDKCMWLRTSAMGAPLPSLLGPKQGQWAKGNIWRNKHSIGDSQEPRGPGGGALRPADLQMLREFAQKQKNAMLGPSEFLLQALDVWQALASHFNMPHLLARSDAIGGSADGEETETESEDEEVEENEEGEEEAASASQTEPRQRSNAEAALASEMEQKNTLEAEAKAQAAMFERRQADFRKRQCTTIETAWKECWDLLSPQCRGSFLSHAAQDVGRGLAQMLQENANRGGDIAGIRDAGFNGFMSRQCAEMAICLAQCRRNVKWDLQEVGMQFLCEFERQVGLSRPSSTTFRTAGQIVVQSHAPEASTCPIPPQCSQVSNLRNWKRAVRQLRPKRSEGHRAQPQGFLKPLPVVPQRHVVSFVICSLRDFASVAATCRRAKELCTEPGSWDGAVLQASTFMSRTPTIGPPRNVRGAAAGRRIHLGNGSGSQGAFGPGRSPVLDQATATLLRLGIKAISSSCPILLDVDNANIRRLAREHQVCGLARPVSVEPWELLERIRHRLPPEHNKSELAETWQLMSTELQSEDGSRRTEGRIVVPRRPPADVLPPAELPSMVVQSHTPATPVKARQLVFGGWCAVQFAEVVFGFGKTVSSEVREVCGLAFACKQSSRAVPRREPLDSLFGQTMPGCSASCNLMIVGSGQPIDPFKRAHVQRLQPGAYVAMHHEDEAEQDRPELQPLSGWSPTHLGSGDRIGLAVVELYGIRLRPSRQHSREAVPEVVSTGLVFVHNGCAVGGRWFPGPDHARFFTSSHCCLFAQPPLTAEGGELTFPPACVGSGPPLWALLGALGGPPKLDESCAESSLPAF